MKVKSGEKINRLSKKDNIQERHIWSWGMKVIEERIALSRKCETNNELSNTI